MWQTNYTPDIRLPDGHDLLWWRLCSSSASSDSAAEEARRPLTAAAGSEPGIASRDDYTTGRRGGAIITAISGATLANILKSVGIGWLFLVAVGGLAMLSLAVSNGGKAHVYPELPTVGLLASPGMFLLLAGLLIDEVKVRRRQRAQGRGDSWL